MAVALLVRLHGHDAEIVAVGNKAACGRFRILSEPMPRALNPRAKRHAPLNAGRDREQAEDIGPAAPTAARPFYRPFRPNLVPARVAGASASRKECADG